MMISTEAQQFTSGNEMPQQPPQKNQQQQLILQQQQQQQQLPLQQQQQAPPQIRYIKIVPQTVRDVKLDNSLRWLCIDQKKAELSQHILEEEIAAIDSYIDRLSGQRKAQKGVIIKEEKRSFVLPTFPQRIARNNLQHKIALKDLLDLQNQALVKTPANELPSIVTMAASSREGAHKQAAAFGNGLQQNSTKFSTQQQQQQQQQQNQQQQMQQSQAAHHMGFQPFHKQQAGSVQNGSNTVSTSAQAPLQVTVQALQMPQPNEVLNNTTQQQLQNAQLLMQLQAQAMLYFQKQQLSTPLEQNPHALSQLLLLLQSQPHAVQQHAELRSALQALQQQHNPFLEQQQQQQVQYQNSEPRQKRKYERKQKQNTQLQSIGSVQDDVGGGGGGCGGGGGALSGEQIVTSREEPLPLLKKKVGRPRKRRNPFVIIRITETEDDVLEDILEPSVLSKRKPEQEQSLAQSDVIKTEHDGNEELQSALQQVGDNSQVVQFGNMCVVPQSTALAAVAAAAAQPQRDGKRETRECDCCHLLVKRHNCKHQFCAKPCARQQGEERMRKSYLKRKGKRDDATGAASATGNAADGDVSNGGEQPPSGSDQQQNSEDKQLKKTSAEVSNAERFNAAIVKQQIVPLKTSEPSKPSEAEVGQENKRSSPPRQPAKSNYQPQQFYEDEELGAEQI